VNKQKFNAKAPGRPRTAKTACTYSHCQTLLATISHPNRQPVFNLESWRSFFASSRLGVAPLVIHPIALVGDLPSRTSLTHRHPDKVWAELIHPLVMPGLGPGTPKTAGILGDHRIKPVHDTV
jgi:hypothetical protein